MIKSKRRMNGSLDVTINRKRGIRGEAELLSELCEVIRAVYEELSSGGQNAFKDNWNGIICPFLTKEEQQEAMKKTLVEKIDKVIAKLEKEFDEAVKASEKAKSEADEVSEADEDEEEEDEEDESTEVFCASVPRDSDLGKKIEKFLDEILKK